MNEQRFSKEKIRELAESGQLKNVDLSQADLAGMDLSGVDLSGAKLAEANFHDVKATQTNFSGANLEKCNFSGSNLKKSAFLDANLVKADLSDSHAGGCCFDNAKMTEANLDMADFGESSLVKTDLREARAKNTIFADCLIDNAIARGMIAPGAVFSGARIEQTDFTQSQLMETRFQGSFLSKVNFSECNLKKADFSGSEQHEVNLSEANIEKAIFKYIFGYGKSEKENLARRGAITRPVIIDRSIRFLQRSIWAKVAIGCIFLAVLSTVFFIWRSYQPKTYEMKNVPTKIDFWFYCAGDAHTKGNGAPVGFDYPSQLAALLNNNDPDHGYEVLNLGHPFYNSSQAVNVILKTIKETKQYPDVIIFNAGKNNDHNLEEATLLPESVRLADFETKLKYLLKEQRKLQLSTKSVNNIHKLLENLPRVFEVGWNSLLDVDEFAEQIIIAKWLHDDLNRLKNELKESETKIILLNYYHGNTWVDAVFSKAASSQDLYFVDIRDFALEQKHNLNKYLSKDNFPSQFGYARIAELIYAQVHDNGLLPMEDNHE